MRHLILAIALSLAAGPVFAVDVVSAWVRQLSLDGYEEITISRTWLGRTRIVAEKGEIEREIILNTRTGEVLRDYSRNEAGVLRLPPGFAVNLDDHWSDDPKGSDGGGGAEDREDDGPDSHDDSHDDGEDDGEDDGKDEGEDDGKDDGGEDD